MTGMKPSTDHHMLPGLTRTVTARAGANFALVKYWGKRDPALNLPAVGSISVTLDGLYSRCRVRLDPEAAGDSVRVNGRDDAAAARRAGRILESVRALAASQVPARIESDNNFPTGAGLASSASGFAALVTAVAAAYGVSLAPAQMSELARLGSGSAARSIWGGFVEMLPGVRDDGSDAVARPLADPEHWPLEVVIAITDEAVKTVASTEGMERTRLTSPFYSAWVEHQPAQLDTMRRAIAERDFEQMAAIAEASALTMHGLAMSARPGLIYFNAATVACLHRIRALRAAGVPVCFTVDAGPQVKAICLPEAADRVASELADIPGVLRLTRSGLGPGARLE